MGYYFFKTRWYVYFSRRESCALFRQIARLIHTGSWNLLYVLVQISIASKISRRSRAHYLIIYQACTSSTNSCYLRWIAFINVQMTGRWLISARYKCMLECFLFLSSFQTKVNFGFEDHLFVLTAVKNINLTSRLQKSK